MNMKNHISRRTRTWAALLALAAARPAAAAGAGAIWSKQCASCHGETGKADTKAGKKQNIPDMSTEKWQGHHSDEKIRAAIADGVPKTKMLAFKEKLTAAEIDSLVKWVRSFRTGQ
jgi:mono/diheme cytochrome c family protein